MYHAFVDVDGKYYDGSGQIDKQYLVDFAEQEYDDDMPIMWDDLEADEATRKILSSNTNWSVDWTDFYHFFESTKR